MAIRRKYSVSDTQKVIFTLLTKLASATAPWSSWQIVYGYPEGEFFKFTKQLLYVMAPFKVGRETHQGGRAATQWEMIIGVWGKGGDEGTGGVEEVDIAAGHILDFFSDPEVYGTTFTCTIGSTTYTNKTLYDHGVIIKSTSGPAEIPVEDSLEYRREVTISLITTF